MEVINGLEVEDFRAEVVEENVTREQVRNKLFTSRAEFMVTCVGIAPVFSSIKTLTLT